VYTLAFVYAPAKNALLDYKDNPTFSMLNDTDGEDGEDVVYGMDSLKHLEK